MLAALTVTAGYSCNKVGCATVVALTEPNGRAEVSGCGIRACQRGMRRRQRQLPWPRVRSEAPVAGDRRPGPRLQTRRCAAADVVEHDAAGTDLHPRADLRASAYVRIRADPRGRIDCRVRFDHRTGMTACRNCRRGVECLRDPRIRGVRIGSDQRIGRAVVDGGRVEHHGCGPGAWQVASILRVGQERDRARAGFLQRRDALDQRVGIAAKFAAEARRQFAQGHWHALAAPRRPDPDPIRASRALDPSPAAPTAPGR